MAVGDLIIVQEILFITNVRIAKNGTGQLKVLGQDDQQLLVIYGSNYIRVHPCHLHLIHENCENPKESTIKQCNPNINHEHLPQTLNNNKTQHHTDIEASDSKDEHSTNNPIINNS